MKSADPALSNGEIEYILKKTANKYSAEPGDSWKTAQQLGAGIVNARAAVAAVRGVENSTDPVDPSNPMPPETTHPYPRDERPVAEKDEECTEAKTVFQKLMPGNWCN